MKKFILPLVLVFSVVLTGCANIKSMRVNAQMKSAQKYLLEEDYEKAIVRFIVIFLCNDVRRVCSWK